MEHRKDEQTIGMGNLPASAPLANAFVPYQMDHPMQYDAQKGIVRGTLYPGLDLPFMGKANKKHLPDTPMTELQVLAFAIQELALYLDTHRNDMEALELYKRYQQLYSAHAQDYSEQCGPLDHMSAAADMHYHWLSDPWPWEYCSNQGD